MRQSIYPPPSAARRLSGYPKKSEAYRGAKKRLPVRKNAKKKREKTVKKTAAEMPKNRARTRHGEGLSRMIFVAKARAKKG